MLLSFRVLGAELFAVEFLRNPPDEKPTMEGGPGGLVETGPGYQPGDVYVQTGFGFPRAPDP